MKINDPGLKAYLFDYADVISLAQDQVLFQQIGQLLEFPFEDFKHRYWAHRRPYDKGEVSGKEYWELVAGKPLTPQTTAEVILLDCKSWSHINPVSLELLHKLKSRGKRLALLSNLPMELVHYVRASGSWTALFDHVFFSAEIQKIKPDREVYEFVAGEMKLKPNEIFFFDDRQENIDGARACGMGALLFEKDTPEKLLRLDLF